MVLPDKVTAQGWALAPIASATRPQGAPLTVILGGKRMPGTEDGPYSVWQVRGIGAALRRGPPTCGKRGSPTWRRRRAPQGYRPKGRDMPAAPESGSSPTSSPALVLAVVPVSVTHSRSMTSRPACVRATGPALGVPEARP